MLVTLVYHLVDGTLDTVNAVSEERFAEQIAHLAGCCQILALDEAIEVVHGRRPMPARGVCITFDDGYRDAVTTALPILAAAGARATLFPIASAIGRSNRWNRRATHDTMHASVAELRSWLHAGMAIGAHTCEHLNLERLDGPELEHQMAHCRAALEELLDTRVRSFAYPYGNAPPAARAAAARHYEVAFAVRDGCWDPTEDPFAVNRIFVRPSWTLEDFAARLERRLAAPEPGARATAPRADASH